MDLWLLVVLTPPWLVGTAWLGGRLFMASIDPQGGDFGAGRGLALAALALVAPAGLARAARAADLGAWWLYLWPYAIVALLAAYVIFVLIINRVTR